VTAVSDRDLAVKHVIQSAFGHSGQKCSATSLLLLQAEVYDRSGVPSLAVRGRAEHAGRSAWELDTKMGPMIKPPSATSRRR